MNPLSQELLDTNLMEAAFNQPADPDETEGRRLYRARADALASAQESLSKRRVKRNCSTQRIHQIVETTR